VYIDSSKKYFVARQHCKGGDSCVFVAKLNGAMFLTGTCRPKQ